MFCISFGGIRMDEDEVRAMLKDLEDIYTYQNGMVVRCPHCSKMAANPGYMCGNCGKDPSITPEELVEEEKSLEPWSKRSTIYINVLPGNSLQIRERFSALDPARERVDPRDHNWRVVCYPRTKMDADKIIKGMLKLQREME